MFCNNIYHLYETGDQIYIKRKGYTPFSFPQTTYNLSLSFNFPFGKKTNFMSEFLNIWVIFMV